MSPSTPNSMNKHRDKRPGAKAALIVRLSVKSGQVV